MIGYSASGSKFSLHSLFRVIDWWLTVILVLRTWAVWDRNRRLFIMLSILYSIIFASTLTILVLVNKSSKCRRNVHAHFWFYGWFIPWQLVHHHIQNLNTRDVSWHIFPAKVKFSCWPYWCSGMLVSVKGLFRFPPSIENITSVADTHLTSCHPSMWAILVSTVGSAHFILLILDRSGVYTSLTTVVYRDGK